jgi:hypothetical protein
MNYCSLDEAFTGPQNPPPGKKTKKTRTKTTVPDALTSQPAVDPDRVAERPPPANDILEGPTHTKPAQLESGVSLEEFFPIPGETTDSWENAFLLEPSTTPLQRPDGSIPVDGKSTLWRTIQQAQEKQDIQKEKTETGPPSEINRRLDALTKQLDALTSPSPMQSTAELFLFVTIGLLLLLAMDILLRFATSITKHTSVVRHVAGFRPRMYNRK